MLNEMVYILPEDKEALLGITGYTEAIFSSYKGDEFLKIFQHYSKLKRDLQLEEANPLADISNQESDQWLSSKRKISVNEVENNSKKSKSSSNKTKTFKSSKYFTKNKKNFNFKKKSV